MLEKTVEDDLNGMESGLEDSLTLEQQISV